jgi:hypothetical protein
VKRWQAQIRRSVTLCRLFLQCQNFMTRMVLIVPGSTLDVQPRSKAFFPPPQRKVTRDPQRRRGFISVGFRAAKPVSWGIPFLDPPESLRLQISPDFSFLSDTCHKSRSWRHSSSTRVGGRTHFRTALNHSEWEIYLSRLGLEFNSKPRAEISLQR